MRFGAARFRHDKKAESMDRDDRLFFFRTVWEGSHDNEFKQLKFEPTQ